MVFLSSRISLKWKLETFLVFWTLKKKMNVLITKKNRFKNLYFFKKKKLKDMTGNYNFSNGIFTKMKMRVETCEWKSSKFIQPSQISFFFFLLFEDCVNLKDGTIVTRENFLTSLITKILLKELKKGCKIFTFPQKLFRYEKFED